MRKPIILDRKVDARTNKSVAESSPETLNACGELVKPVILGYDSMNQE
jgi:hypothetical protein